MLGNEILNQTNGVFGQISPCHVPCGNIKDPFMPIVSYANVGRLVLILHIMHFDNNVIEARDNRHRKIPSAITIHDMFYHIIKTSDRF